MKVVIWTGPAWETWGPGSLETGVGGSELAAIYVSAELARLGHEVEVVGQVTPMEHLGVRYVDYRDYAADYGNREMSPGPRVECDVFISSRHLQALHHLRPDARLKVLWMHDVHAGPDYSKQMCAYDVVFCLSDWALQVARKFYPHVPPDKFVRTRNGIDAGIFREEPRKEGYRVVYSSSPDRGLDRLLDFWPTIKKLQPDAELHVYYGFDTWERMATHYCDDVALAQIQIFRTRLANMAGQGVVTRGRVGQAELARAWLGASLWLYPTNFCETSCITAMEAQAAGVLGVTSRLAALPETARYAHLVDPPNTREGYREEFLQHVEEDERSDDYAERVVPGREWALRELGWEGVARQWDEVFRGRTR